MTLKMVSVKLDPEMAQGVDEFRQTLWAEATEIEAVEALIGIGIVAAKMAKLDPDQRAELEEGGPWWYQLLPDDALIHIVEDPVGLEELMMKSRR